ncbi:MAG: hypothetical protein IPP47_08240 [Bryobacterales bacterium]|nr:hypothetical protein [Bryobacterales bacterium]
MATLHPRLIRYGPALLACGFLVCVYWRGLDTWFYQDDFGWLHLGPAKSFGDFLHIIFAPKAHGNVRPWSENAYFYALKALFGIDSVPFRVVVYATVMANLFLLDSILRRLTGSAWAAFAGLIFWLASPGIAPGLCWSSIYNQALSTFFLLLSLLLLMQRRWRAHVIVFALGLGSLETVVMYPAIAALYLWLYDRAQLRRVLPLFAISAAFTVLHFLVAPSAKTGPYAMQFDARILRTFWSYLEMALGPERLGHFYWMWPAWVVPALTAAMLAGLLAALLLAGRAGVLGAGWFVLILAPVLLLPDHVMDYLLFAPAVGVAIVLACALSRRPRSFAAVALFYVACGLPATWHIVRWNYERSQISRTLVLGVVEYSRAHPGKTLLLTGMDTDQFHAGYADLPFELFGMKNVFLAPGGDAKIQDSTGIAPLYVLAPDKAGPLLAAGRAVILDISGGQLREVPAAKAE